MAGGKKDDVSNKLDELINQYNKSNSGRDAKLAKQSDKRPLSEADRKRLIENGVPIDPELVKQVAGDESAPIVQKPVSNGKKDTVLKTSSGEIIDTKNISDALVQPGRSDDDIADDANDSPSRTLSDKYVRREGREIQRILKRARRKYGKERYNRLDPANYTSQKLYEAKRRKLYRRIAIAVAAIIGIAIVGLVIAFILYKRANPTLVYTVNVCSEQDVVDAIKNYRDGDVGPISTYLDGKIGQEGYSIDTKCAYISALEFKMNGIKSGVNYQLDRYQNTSDRDAVDQLIERYDGPSYDELRQDANSMDDSATNTTPSGGADGTLLQETVVIDEGALNGSTAL